MARGFSVVHSGLGCVIRDHADQPMEYLVDFEDNCPYKYGKMILHDPQRDHHTCPF